MLHEQLSFQTWQDTQDTYRCIVWLYTTGTNVPTVSLTLRMRAVYTTTLHTLLYNFYFYNKYLILKLIKYVSATPDNVENKMAQP